MVQMIEVVCPYCQALLELPSTAEGGPVEGSSIICSRCEETFVLSGTAPVAPVPGPTGEYALGSVSDVKASVGGIVSVWWMKFTTTMWGLVLAVAIFMLLSVVFFAGWMVGDDFFSLIGLRKR